MTKDDVYCVMPFLGLALKPDGRIKPCCRFRTWDDDDSRNWFNDKEINHNIVGTHNSLHSTAFESVRQDMLDGKPIRGCAKCYDEERLNTEKGTQYSMRQFYNNQYKNVSKVGLQYLEVSFGNYCNLSCRTCGSGLSSTWYEDDLSLSKAYDIEVHEKIIDIPFNWNTDDFKDITEIKFVGGEPMLNPNFSKFLQTVIDSGQASKVRLSIFTNCSWFPKSAVIEMLAKFNIVNIWLSIDAYGSKNDYIRNKSNWQTVQNCASKWLQYEKDGVLGVMLTPAISILNSHILDELIEWWIILRRKFGLPFKKRSVEKPVTESGDIVFSSVVDPRHYDFRNAPNRRQSIEKYKQCAEKHDDVVLQRFYQKAISVLSQNLNKSVDLSEFVTITKDLDKLRQQSFKLVFPELYKIIEDDFATVNGKL